MRDLSLHLLDVIENAIRAGATSVRLTIEEDPALDLVRLTVEDDGPGLSVPPEAAVNPFYTTKRGKRTGLGLSLFRACAEQAGGRLELTKSELGGLAVACEMRLSHIDRSPLGDIAATVSSIVCTTPGLDFECRILVGKRRWAVKCSDVMNELGPDEQCGIIVARHVSDRIKAALADLEVTV